MVKFWKNRRKTKLIKGKYQLKVILMFLIISIITFTALIYSHIKTTIEYKRSVKKEITTLEKCIKTQNDIVNSYIKYARTIPNPDYRIRTKPIEEDHTKSIEGIKKHIPEIESFIERYKKILIITVIVLIIYTLVIIKMLLIYTSRMLKSKEEKKWTQTGKTPVKISTREKEHLKAISEKLKEAKERYEE